MLSGRGLWGVADLILTGIVAADAWLDRVECSDMLLLGLGSVVDFLAVAVSFQIIRPLKIKKIFTQLNKQIIIGEERLTTN